MSVSLVRASLQRSYYHILALFVVLVAAVTLGLFPEDYRILPTALVLGLLGAVLTRTDATWRLPTWLVWVAIGVALFTRVAPYFASPVPLGYDPGFHRFLFLHPFAEEWTKGMYPLPFTLLFSGLTALFGITFTLVPLFVVLSVALVPVLYLVGKRLYGETTGVLAALLFAVSIAQFETYWYHYYKNVIGIGLLLVSFLYFKYGWNWRLVLLGGVLAGMHQVAFFLFGVTLFVWAMLDVANWRSARFWGTMCTGVAVALVALLVNADRVMQFLLPQANAIADSVLSLSGGAGTFFDSSQYLLYSLMFVPFAITGLLHYWRKNLPVTICTLVSASIVVFGLIFHNRLLIYLDIFVILFAALGFEVLVANRPRYGAWLVWGFLAVGVVLVVLHALDSKALISDAEFAEIQGYNALVEPGAAIMVTDRAYSPWIKGWVDRPVIAPGLFDENRMSQEEWNSFWLGTNRTTYLNEYTVPIYIHLGERQRQYDVSDVCPDRVAPHLYRCTT